MSHAVCAMRSEAGLGSRTWQPNTESMVTRGGGARIRAVPSAPTRAARAGQRGKHRTLRRAVLPGKSQPPLVWEELLSIPFWRTKSQKTSGLLQPIA